MSPEIVLSRLRRFLFVLSALLLAGTLAELWLVNHTENFVQLIPFALCGVGLIALFVALWRPRRAPLWGLRVCMMLVLAGSFYGVYEHVWNNFAFERELYPQATTRSAVLGALGGANPLLAPGILGIAAVLALAATYKHTALDKSEPPAVAGGHF